MKTETLTKRVKDSNLRTEVIAAALEISVPTLYAKIKGESEFKLSEAVRLSKLLMLSREEFCDIFLT